MRLEREVTWKDLVTCGLILLFLTPLAPIVLLLSLGTWKKHER